MAHHAKRDLYYAFSRATAELPGCIGSVSGNTVVETLLDGAKAVIKRYRDTDALDVELRAYVRLGGAGIAPQLLAEDRPHCMLAFEHVGRSVEVLRTGEPELYRRALPRLQSQFAAAVKCLWRTYGIVHDDLYPQNLCVDDAGVLRVIDYGSRYSDERHGTLLRGPGEGKQPVAPRLPPPPSRPVPPPRPVPRRLSMARIVGRW